MKIECSADINDNFLEPLREEIRNQVKREVAIAVNQVDIKTIINEAVKQATKTLKVTHYEVEVEKVKHYEIEKEKIKVPEIIYIKTPVKIPVFKTQQSLIEDA